MEFVSTRTEVKKGWFGKQPAMELGFSFTPDEKAFLLEHWGDKLDTKMFPTLTLREALTLSDRFEVKTIPVKDHGEYAILHGQIEKVLEILRRSYK